MQVILEGDEASLPPSDKTKLRRWRSDEMRPGGETMRVLTDKINRDLAEVFARKKRSPIQKPDWR